MVMKIEAHYYDTKCSSQMLVNWKVHEMSSDWPAISNRKSWNLGDNSTSDLRSFRGNEGKLPFITHYAYLKIILTQRSTCDSMKVFTFCDRKENSTGWIKDEVYTFQLSGKKNEKGKENLICQVETERNDVVRPNFFPPCLGIQIEMKRTYPNKFWPTYTSLY